jgi:hypothetical protein
MRLCSALKAAARIVDARTGGWSTAPGNSGALASANELRPEKDAFDN